MKTVHLGRLQRAAASRKPGYLEAHIKVGAPVTIFGQPFYRLTDADYLAIRKEFALTLRTDTQKVSVPNHNPNPNPNPNRAPQPLRQRPSLLKMTGNALGATGRLITAATTNQPIYVPDSTNEQRLAKCAACDQLRNKDKGREAWSCAMCGCFLAGKLFAKARLATERCPKKKW